MQLLTLKYQVWSPTGSKHLIIYNAIHCYYFTCQVKKQNVQRWIVPEERTIYSANTRAQWWLAVMKAISRKGVGRLMYTIFSTSVLSCPITVSNQGIGYITQGRTVPNVYKHTNQKLYLFKMFIFHNKNKVYIFPPKSDSDSHVS